MVEVVVARYKEDISWLKEINHKIIVYNKGPDCNFPCISLPNIGREAQTYLFHIIENYNKLPEWTILCQGHPFDHCKNAISILNKIPISFDNLHKYCEGCYGIADRYLNETQQDVQRLNVWHQDFYKKFFSTPKSRFHFACGAQYAIHISNIQAKPLSFYKRILSSYSWNDHEPWSIERIWPEIFDIRNLGKFKYKQLI